jgi:hypothetical protein
MTQVTGVQEFFEAMVEVCPAGGAWTDISGWGATVAVSGRERQAGEGFTHDGDRAIVGHGKLQPLDVTVRAIYTEGGLDPYAIVLPALENHAVLQVRWSPYGGQAGEKQYTTNLTHSHVINCPAPSGEAGSGDPVMLEFTVRTSDIASADVPPVTCSFPSSAILDSFNRADEMPLNQTNWQDVYGTLVVANQGRINSVGLVNGLGSSFYNTAFGPDCDVYVSIPAINRTIFPLTQVVVFARYDVDAENGYSVRMDYITGGGGWAGTIYLDRIDAGVATNLASYNVTLANGDGIGVRCDDDDISAYHYTLGAWALLGTETDATYAAAGLCGIRACEPFPGSGVMYLDDFGAGDETGAAFPEPGVLDNFNRADEGPPPSAGWVDKHVMGVVSNECAARQTPNDYGGPFTANMLWRAVFAANQIAFVTTSVRQLDGGDVYLVARLQDTDNCVALYVYRDDTGGDTVEIIENVAGVFSTIGGPHTIDYQDGDTFGIRCTGDTIEACHRPLAGAWTLLGSGVTTLPVAGGKIGLDCRDTTVRFDDFGGGDI